MWFVAAGLGAILILYMWVLLSLKGRAHQPRRVPATANGQSSPTIGLASSEDRNAATPSRPEFHDLDIFGDDEPVHVVVRTASAGV
jgi:hypothetical protein